MMKKLISILFMLALTMPVNAEEIDYVKDKMTIESLNTNIVILDDDTYRVTENYSTKVIFGDLPSTFYFEKNIPLTYDYSYNRVKYSYKVTPTLLKVLSDTYFLTSEEEDNLKIQVGDGYELYSESKDIVIEYDVKLDKKEPFFSYVLASNLYDTKETTFSVAFPYELEGKSIKFSLDGKNFSDEIDGLTYKIENKYILTGKYSKLINANQSLILRVGDQKYNAISSNEILTYVSLAALLLVIVIFIVYIVKRKKK